MSDTKNKGGPLVDVEGMSVRVIGSDRPPILEDISFRVEPGKMTALVGESGAGKSMSTKALLGILDDRLFTVEGRISVDGTEVGSMSTRARRRYTSSVAALVFQNPTRALNPTMRVGPQIAESLRFSRSGPRLSRAKAQVAAVDLMKQVGIAAPDERFFAYPHEMSGGMKQRAVIAIALSMNPKMLFCDEPTASLDVTTQALIMDLLDELRERLGLGILFITHDLVLAASRADDVLVLHSGRLVERVAADELFTSAAMPYTRDLIARVPGIGGGIGGPVVARPLPLTPIGASAGCHYANECSNRQDVCGEQVPPLEDLTPDHAVRCWFPIGYPSTGLSETPASRRNEVTHDV